MKLLIFITLLFSLCYGQAENGQENNDQNMCDLKNLANKEKCLLINEPKDDDTDEPFLKINAGDISTVTVSANNDYIEAEIIDDEIVIRPSANFKHFEEEFPSNSEEGDVIIKALIQLDNKTTIDFQQPIKDKNNHPPVFNREIYEYKFGMELDAGFELTSLLTIVATDIDITNTNITFSLDDPTNVDIQEQSSIDDLNKSYSLILTTKEKIIESTDIRITAKDDSKDSEDSEETKETKESSAIIKITIIQQSEDDSE